MPPRPRHSRISKLGKCGAISAGVGGTVLGPLGELVLGPVSSVWVAMFIAIRQRGHSPAGEFAGSGSPHWGQINFVVLLMSVTYRWAGEGYTAARFSPRARASA